MCPCQPPTLPRSTPSRWIPVLLAGTALVLPSCKLPNMSGFAADEKHAPLRAGEALASAGTNRLHGEESWSKDFFRPLGRSWSSVTPAQLDENAAVTYALNHGLDVATGKVGLGRAEAEQRLARSSFLPKLIAQLDAGEDIDRTAANISRQEFDFGTGLYVRQDVFSWGANLNRYRSAKLRAAGQRSQVEVLRNTTAASVRVGFANYRRTMALVAAYKQGAAELSGLVDSARKRAAAGVESKRGVAELEARLAEFQARSAAIDTEAEGVRDELTALLGSNAPLAFTTGAMSPLKLPEMGRDALVNRALQGRPDLKMLASLSDAARGEVSATKKSRLPTIALSAGVKSEYDLDGDQRGPDFRAGASSRWIPAAGGQHKANIDIAKADLRQAELELAHARRKTISGINGALDQSKAAEHALEANYRSLLQARSAQALSLQVYKQDSTQIDPLVEAHEDVVRALASHANNRAALDIALIRIHHLLGACAGMGEAKTSLAKL